MISRYGMPLYPLTAWLVDHSHQLFGRYQADVYEAGTDPVTFFSLLGVIIIYAVALYWLIKILLNKLRNKSK